MYFTEMAFRRKAMVWFILFSIVVGGILSFRSISKLEDPELVVMMAEIVTLYPGASAHEVEMQVTNVIEEALGTLADVESIRSKSMPNLSTISLSLDLRVPQDEVEQRWDYLRRRIGELEGRLPEGAYPPMIFDNFGDVYGMFYAMTADGYSYNEMNKVAQFIRREMLEVEGVARVEIFGEQEMVNEIVFNTSKMGELGVNLFQVLSSLQNENAAVFPGMLQTGNKLLNISVDGKIKSKEDVENIIIKGLDGSLFKLSDIAQINEVYTEPIRNNMHLNNKEALAISLSMESGDNIVEVGKRVEKRLEELKKNLPVGYEFDKVFFQPELVKNAIDGFMWNLVASVVIVILVLMVSMGLRSGFIIGTGLVLTILATFPILLMAGGTLQRISLGAFIVAMGMLVDNAIVVIDGILVDLQKGIDRKKALVNPATRTAWPLFGATFIAVVAFLPVFISKDIAGTYVRDLFVVLSISLFVSWVLAMTQIPVFAERLLKIRKKKQSKELYQSWGYQKFRSFLGILMHYKTTTLLVAFLILALAVYSFKNVKDIFFVDFDYNQVYIEYKLPPGTGPDQVNNDLYEITEHLLSLDEVNKVVSSQGQTPARYCLTRPMGEPSDNYGELIVDFEDYETMIRMRPVIRDYLIDNFPDSRSRIRKYSLSIKASHTVEVEFSGPDPAVLKDLSSQAQQIFHNNPYADKLTIEDDWEPTGQVLVANYARQTAARIGTSRSEIGLALLAATDGIPVGDYFDGQSRVGLIIKLRNSDGSKIENLEDIPVWSMMPDFSGINEKAVQELLMGIKTIDDLTGELISPVPLSAVSEGITLDWQEQVVRRTNGRRAIQVQCEPLDGNSPALVRKAMLKEIENIELPDGYKAVWVGEYELQKEALTNIFRYIPISVLLIILTLILLFNDLRKPIIVILCIPMAFVGIVYGMILTGQPFTFMAIIGSFGLMGMIVKNAIVLIDEAEMLIAKGTEKYYALINATISRTRPVLLTSLTTIMGMIPLLTDPMYASMATAIISGLVVGTFVTLVFVPILYVAFYGVKRVEKQENNAELVL